mmetsp:Transcript_30072/g.45831  ORF Transcript_30072/g.45831 Transcript_30072/m.45831 type:complete len:116 (-) Transcript_30072:29-376(-)
MSNTKMLKAMMKSMLKTISASSGNGNHSFRICEPNKRTIVNMINRIRQIRELVKASNRSCTTGGSRSHALIEQRQQPHNECLEDSSSTDSAVAILAYFIAFLKLLQPMLSTTIDD